MLCEIDNIQFSFVFFFLTYHSSAFATIFPLQIRDVLIADVEYFDGLLIDYNNDEDLENLKNIAMDNFILTEERKNCEAGNILKVAKLQEMFSYSNASSFQKYVKNPCLTYLVIQESSENLIKAQKELKIPGQPYFFAIDKTGDLLEVQIFSQKIVSVKSNISAIERRSDFNGAVVKMAQSATNPYKLFIPIVQNQLNFTIENEKYEGFGSVVNGSWIGAVRQLMEFEIDVGMLQSLTINFVTLQF